MLQLRILEGDESAMYRRHIEQLLRNIIRIRQIRDSDGPLAACRHVLGEVFPPLRTYRLIIGPSLVGNRAEALMQWSISTWERLVYARLNDAAHMGIIADASFQPHMDQVLQEPVAVAGQAVSLLVTYVLWAWSVMVH